MLYHNRQIGSALLAFIGIITGFILFASIGKNDQVIWPVIVILSLVALLFHSLNIDVNRNAVNWSFGPGFWKKSISIASIHTVKIVEIKWYYGLGIRLMPSGWLYTVSGTSAIELELKDGSKVTLGTNDADNLKNNIQALLT